MSGSLCAARADTCLDLDPQLEPGEGDSHAHKHNNSRCHDGARPQLRDEIATAHGINNGTRCGCARQGRKRRQRLYHAETRAHLTRVTRQAGKRRDKGCLIGANDDAIEHAKGIHARARGNASPGEEKDTHTGGSADEDVDGAEEIVG